MKKSISISRTAHYYIQEPENQVKKVLFIIHGYAQLAGDFIKEFEYLKTSSTLVVAPEGLSKFYNKSRKPVANWMTSHEREDEIADYVKYLIAVEREIFTTYGNTEKIALGFSQGVSTLFRWLIASEYESTSIYACSGSIPPELNSSAVSTIKKSTIHYSYGNNDGLQPIESAIKQINFLKSLSLIVSAHPFNGGHEVSNETKSLIENT
ncbi:MAG: hypothetical protein RJQ00_02170 [Vicingaceae bacterium]